MSEFLWALRFLTIIPIGHGDVPPQRMGMVMSLFPAVGLFIGLCLVLLYAPLIILFPDELADALIIIALISITGALHIDGLADYMDGILGGWDARSRLEIMKDSRIGTFGVLGIVGIIGLKYLSLNGIGAHVPQGSIPLGTYLSSGVTLAEKAPVLLLMPVVGRWAQTLSAAISPYARDEPGTAWALVGNTHVRHAMIASLLPVFMTGLLFGGEGLIITAVLAALIIIKTSYINSRIGGVTGDTLGAINEESELVFLLLFYII